MEYICIVCNVCLDNFILIIYVVSSLVWSISVQYLAMFPYVQQSNYSEESCSIVKMSVVFVGCFQELCVSRI